MNLQDNIKRMEQELADMKKQLEQQDKLELKGGVGYYLRGWDKPVEGTLKADTLTVTRGAFRATKELAEIADKNMVTHNRLEAYVHQIQGDGEGAWIIGYSSTKGYDLFNKEGVVKYLGVVYMQHWTAEILCKALNASEIEL